MGRRWIFGSVIAFVLVLSFVFPRIMLLIEQANGEEKVLTYGTGTMLKMDGMSLVQKQSHLATPGRNISAASVPASDQLRLNNVYLKELETLRDLGAITISTYEDLMNIALHGMVLLCTTFDTHRAESFRYYRIETGDGYVLIDEDSKKILSLGFYTPFDTYILMEADESASDMEEMLRSWAEYYSLSLEEISFMNTWREDRPIAQCTFRDLKDRFIFGFSFSEASGIWSWGPVYLLEEDSISSDIDLVQE